MKHFELFHKLMSKTLMNMVIKCVTWNFVMAMLVSFPFWMGQYSFVMLPFLSRALVVVSI